jgi:hypothetical protein
MFECLCVCVRARVCVCVCPCVSATVCLNACVISRAFVPAHKGRALPFHIQVSWRHAMLRFAWLLSRVLLCQPSSRPCSFPLSPHRRREEFPPSLLKRMLLQLQGCGAPHAIHRREEEQGQREKEQDWPRGLDFSHGHDHGVSDPVSSPFSSCHPPPPPVESLESTQVDFVVV